MHTIKQFSINFIKIILFAIILLFFIFLFIAFYFNIKTYQGKENTIFLINKGENFRNVVENLYKNDIIENPIIFYYCSKVLKKSNLDTYYGEYLLKKNFSYFDILRKITSRNFYLRKITLIEGATNDEIFNVINNTQGLKGEIPNNIEEGSLLPNTYYYSYNDSKASIINRMQRKMTETIDKLWLERNITIPIKNKKEAIILASIVEKESGIINEKPKIASVFINRINKGIKLQSDPTVIYSFTKGDPALKRKIKTKDIRNKSKFNTYNIYGLPPTPISNPSIESIKAVLNPLKTKYLYFVASGNGGHNFSYNLKQHNIYVRQYYRIINNKK